DPHGAVALVRGGREDRPVLVQPGHRGGGRLRHAAERAHDQQRIVPVVLVHVPTDGVDHFGGEGARHRAPPSRSSRSRSSKTSVLRRYATTTSASRRSRSSSLHAASSSWRRYASLNASRSSMSGNS